MSFFFGRRKRWLSAAALLKLYQFRLLKKAELQLKENDRVLIEKGLSLKELELKLQRSRGDCVTVKLIQSLSS